MRKKYDYSQLQLGVLKVLTSIPATGTNITVTQGANSLTLSWPASYLGWSLQAQTNNLDKGISTNWVTIPGSETNTSVVVPLNPANPTVFYRMFYQP